MFMMRTPRWTVERRTGEAFFRVVRLAAPMALDDFAKDAEAFDRAFAGANTSRLGLLVDMHGGPNLRNDAAFEAMLGEVWKRLVSRFGRIAFVLGTPAGQLQGRRLIAQLNASIELFSDEKSAADWLATAGS